MCSVEEGASDQRTRRDSLNSEVPMDACASQAISKQISKNNTEEHKAVNRALEKAAHKVSETHRTGQNTLGTSWWQEEQPGEYGPIRKYLAKLVFSPAFELLLTAVILTNLGFVVYETDQEAKCFPRFQGDDFDDCPTNGANIAWMYACNLCFLALYSFEAATKICVTHLKYFKRFDTCFDLLICILGWSTIFLSGFVSLSWLRVFRLWRIMRILNSMSRVPEIHMLIAGLAGAMRAMLFGAVLLILALLFCAIVIVQIIYPISTEIDFGDCPRCSRAYGSVADTILTIFTQVVAGDGWGTINIAVIEKKPAVGLMLPIFQMLIAMGVMNLILAVVVDRSVEAREKNKERLLHQRTLERETQNQSLLAAIGNFDKDFSGTLSRAELETACRTSPIIMHSLAMANIGREDLKVLLDYVEIEAESVPQSEGYYGVKYEDFCKLIRDVEEDIHKLTMRSQLGNHARYARNVKEREAQEERLQRIERKLDHLISLGGTTSGEEPRVFCTSIPAMSGEEKGTLSHESAGAVEKLHKSLTSVYIEACKLNAALDETVDVTRGFLERSKASAPQAATNGPSEVHHLLLEDVHHIETELAQLRANFQSEQERHLQHLRHNICDKSALLKSQCRLLDRACSHTGFSTNVLLTTRGQINDGNSTDVNSTDVNILNGKVHHHLQSAPLVNLIRCNVDTEDSLELNVSEDRLTWRLE